MSEQNFANHSRLVTGYHFVLFGLLALTLIGAGVNLFKAIRSDGSIYDASLILVLTVCVAIAAYYARLFALKAQDRAIRAEEQLRHFVLTGKLLDSRLSVRQIIGLRFAGDEEVAALAARAANEGLSEKAIKAAIRSWRADTYRV